MIEREILYHLGFVSPDFQSETLAAVDGCNVDGKHFVINQNVDHAFPKKRDNRVSFAHLVSGEDV